MSMKSRCLLVGFGVGGIGLMGLVAIDYERKRWKVLESSGKRMERVDFLGNNGQQFWK